MKLLEMSGVLRGRAGLCSDNVIWIDIQRGKGGCWALIPLLEFCVASPEARTEAFVLRGKA
jgi:hypothetical protein